MTPKQRNQHAEIDFGKGVPVAWKESKVAIRKALVQLERGRHRENIVIIDGTHERGVVDLGEDFPHLGLLIGERSDEGGGTLEEGMPVVMHGIQLLSALRMICDGGRVETMRHGRHPLVVPLHIHAVNGNAVHPIGIMMREVESDVAAHGKPKHVGLGDLEMVERGTDVIGKEVCREVAHGEGRGAMAAEVECENVKVGFEAPQEGSRFELRASGGPMQKEERGCLRMASLIHNEVIAVVRYMSGIERRRGRLAKLDEDAVRLLGVEEKDTLVVGARAGGIAEGFKAPLTEVLHGGLDVVDFERHVMQAFAAPLQKAGDRGVGAEGFEEFYLGRLSTEKMRAHALFGHRFDLVGEGIQQRGIEIRYRRYVLDSDADVFEMRHAVH